MAWEAPVQTLPFRAAIEMSSSGLNESTSAGQYRCMRSSAAGYVRYQENSTGTIVGVLQNAPIANEGASVTTYGVTKLWVTSSAAQISVGETVGCSTDGRATEITTAVQALVGVALQPCSSGPLLISVLLTGPGGGGSTVNTYV